MPFQIRALYWTCCEFGEIRTVLHSNRFPHFLMQLHIYMALNDAEHDDSVGF